MQVFTHTIPIVLMPPRSLLLNGGQISPWFSWGIPWSQKILCLSKENPWEPHENPIRIPPSPTKTSKNPTTHPPKSPKPTRNNQKSSTKTMILENPCNKTSFFVARPSLPACATWPSSSRRRRKRNCCRRWMHDPGWTTWFEVGIGPLWPYLGSHSEDLAMKNGEKTGDFTNQHEDFTNMVI